MILAITEVLPGEDAEEYLAALGEKGRKKVVFTEVTNGQKFRFGGGQFLNTKEEIPNTLLSIMQV